jgi:hypothetical protein
LEISEVLEISPEIERGSLLFNGMFHDIFIHLFFRAPKEVLEKYDILSVRKVADNYPKH